MTTKINQVITVYDAFKRFCKERHAEDRGRNYNFLQEIYANTELFDLSFIGIEDETKYKFSIDYRNFEGRTTLEWLKNYALPFSNMFLFLGYDKETEKASSLFIREYSFNIITGTLYAIIDTEGTATINSPFTLHVDTGELIVNGVGLRQWAEYKGVKDLHKAFSDSEEVRTIFAQSLSNFSNIIVDRLKILTELPKHSVVADVTGQTEYYPRKHASTLKTVRPIYYVLNKQEETNPTIVHRIKARGKLEFTHSFKVRSHWRKLHNPNTLGKNRNGEYVVKGMTFVRESIKGEGELVKRLRVIK